MFIEKNYYIGNEDFGNYFLLPDGCLMTEKRRDASTPNSPSTESLSPAIMAPSAFSPPTLFNLVLSVKRNLAGKQNMLQKMSYGSLCGIDVSIISLSEHLK